MAIEIFHLPIASEDLEVIERLTREWDPFLTTNLEADDPYSILGYLRAGGEPDFEVFGLLDRNLISCVGNLSEGREVPSDPASAETYRVAAACMVYFILGRAQLDPAIAIHEFADSHDSDTANVDLRKFRVADHVPPEAYAAIALGRSNRLSEDHLAEARTKVESRSSPEPHYDFSYELAALTKHQASLTKIALLERQPGSRRAKVERYLQWCFDEAFFNAGAHTFAVIYFGNRRQRGMLKGAGSGSLDSCLRGVRNAAWDLVYLSRWAQQATIEDPSRAWLFCSRDRLALEIARGIAVPKSAESHAEAQLQILRRNWSESDAVRLHDYYTRLWSEIERDPEARKLSMSLRRSSPDILRDLEREIASTF